MRALSLTLAAFLVLSIPALAENVYQTAIQVQGFDFTSIGVSATKIIAAPPIATQSIKVLALQEMTVSTAGGAIELDYSASNSCSSPTLFAVLSTSTASIITTTNNVELGYGTAPIFVVPAGDALCVISTASVTTGTIAGTYIYQ